MSTIDKIGNETLEDMFSEAFEAQVASVNSISSYEVKCSRNVYDNKSEIVMNINITGMAGDPTLQDWVNNKIKDYKRVAVEVGNNKFLFVLDLKQCSNLSLIDYIIAYRFVKQI